jgi:hypothetical protein
MALIISSFSKLLLILMIIWNYSRPEYARLIGLFEITSNLEAISGKDIITRCSNEYQFMI